MGPDHHRQGSPTEPCNRRRVSRPGHLTSAHTSPHRSRPKGYRNPVPVQDLHAALGRGAQAVRHHPLGPPYSDLSRFRGHHPRHLDRTRRQHKSTRRAHLIPERHRPSRARQRSHGQPRICGRHGGLRSPKHRCRRLHPPGCDRMLTHPVTGKAGHSAAGLRWVPGRVFEIRRSEHPQIAGACPPLTEKRCYRTPKPPIIGVLTVHMTATNNQGRRQPR